MKFLRIGICALIAMGVLAHGGVEDWAKACFEIGAALLFWPGQSIYGGIPMKLS